MNTDDLVRILSSQAEAVEPGAGVRRHALVLGTAVVAALGLTGAVLGWNRSLLQDAAAPMFWARETFCAALSAAGVLMASRLGRPGRPIGWAPVGIAVPLCTMWALAAIVVYTAPPVDRGALFMGQTALVCPWLIALVSAPVFAAVIWLLRGMAPTRLRMAGAAAGFAAGAVGALVYTLHCPEYAAPFLGVWYVIGMLIPALVGAWVGPRWLRW